MFIELNNKYKNFNASFNTEYMKVFIEHIYDINELREVLQDYASAIFKDYFIEITNIVKNHCKWIKPEIFDGWMPILLFITNKYKFDGFCICLTNGRNDIDIAEIYNAEDVVVNDVIYFNICDFATEYVEVYDGEVMKSRKKVYDSYLDIIAKELYKAEVGCGFYFKELQYLTGNCDIPKFKYILRQIDEYGKHELIHGDILPYNSGFDSSNLDKLVSLTDDVKDNCKVLTSTYTEVDMLGCTSIFVDVLISWGDYDKIYIHFYDGDNALYKDKNHAALIKSSIHVEHIAVFIPEHKICSIIGNTGSAIIAKQIGGIFTAQSNSGVKIDLRVL